MKNSLIFFFFFSSRRRHTRSDRDWSSDVCSSDLERADEDELMPLVARALGGPATATMRRTHAEIEHQVSRLRRLLDGIDPDHVEPEDVTELRRLLYGLYAVCRLHNSQEEEGAFALVPAKATPARRNGRHHAAG